ncbi:hypothetical protein [Nocardia terpenica]|uniref:hypothetical protein n=1 Tax=Nocardia terpenica TaxID=455432 RepID=UPI0002D75929|nr:hypothetical protein [Nocardia terpenica]NQE88077.1 hypothetical protein [Nocardia terpenica]
MKRAHDEVAAILRYAARGGVEALESIAAELKSQIASERPRRKAAGLQDEVDAAVEAYTRRESTTDLNRG